MMTLVISGVIVGLLVGFGGVAAQVPSYTVTYTQYSESISTLLDVSTTYAGHSKLIGGLYDVGNKSAFTTEQNSTYYNFVSDLETTVINNSSITNETYKLFYAAKAISEFNVSEPVIFGTANQFNITGWSRLSTFVSITNNYHFDTSLQLVYYSSNTVKLFELIKNTLLLSGATAEYTDFEAFIESDLQVIVSSTALTEADKLAQIYAAFINVFFVQHSSYYNTFYRLDFGVYGNFYQFFQNGLIYYQQSQASNLILGDVDSCPFLKQLNASVYNTSLPFPNTVRGQLRQFYLAVYQGFQTTTTLEARFDFINAKFGEFCGLQPAYFGWFDYVRFGIFGRFTQIVEYWATWHICGGHFPWDGKPVPGTTTTTAATTTTTELAPVTSAGTTIEDATVSTTVDVSTATATRESYSTESSGYSTNSTDVTTEGTSGATPETTVDTSTSETTEGVYTTDSTTTEATSEATSESITELTSETTTGSTPTEGTTEAISESTSESTLQTVESSSTTVSTTDLTSNESSTVTTETVTDVSTDSSSDVSSFTTSIPSSSTQCSCTCA